MSAVPENEAFTEKGYHSRTVVRGIAQAGVAIARNRIVGVTSGRISGGKNERSPTIVAAKSTLVSHRRRSMFFAPHASFWKEPRYSCGLPVFHSGMMPPRLPRHHYA